MPKKKGTEIGIEGALVLAAFLVDRAREWGDVRPNVFWEYGCWAAIAGLLLRIFWISPWTRKLKRGPRLGVVVLVPLLLVICNWQTARDKYYSQHSEHTHPTSIESKLDGTTTFEQLRSMLHEINPGILTEIDNGQTQIPIFLTGATYNKLRKFMETNTTAQDYVSLEPGRRNTLIGIGGPYDRYAGILIEKIPDGPFTDYIIVPGKRLRKDAAVDPLKKRCLNFADSLDAFVNEWSKTNWGADTRVMCYSQFTLDFEVPLQQLRAAIEDAGIYSHNLSTLGRFPSQVNDINAFSSNNILNISKEIRRVADKL